MDSSSKKILGAFLVGFAIVLLAVLVKGDAPVPENEGGLAVVNEAISERNYIEVVDSDNDGIPDWQESLQKTDPVTIESAGADFVPDTLTEQFAVSFFQDMVYAGNINALDGDPEALAERAINQLDSVAKEDTLYTIRDIRLDNNESKEAIKLYGNTMGNIVTSRELPEGYLNEVEILNQAYILEDKTRLDDLDIIIKMYEEIIAESLNVIVPASMAQEHLVLINVYNSIYNDIKAMKLAFSDPLKAVVRIKRYEEDVTVLYIALLNLQKKILDSGIVYTELDPAYRFFINQ